MSHHLDTPLAAQNGQRPSVAKGQRSGTFPHVITVR
jgi:hypothetical protein